MTVRGIRGAITIEKDEKEEVLNATAEMLEGIMDANKELIPEDISSAIFTTTEDVVSAFPAAAARRTGVEKCSADLRA